MSLEIATPPDPSRAELETAVTPRRPSLWRQGDFMKLWTAQTISQFGDEITGIALPFLAITILGANAFEMGVLGVVRFLPWILFTLPAGVWVDRMRRRPILIGADVARAAPACDHPDRVPRRMADDLAGLRGVVPGGDAGGLLRHRLPVLSAEHRRARRAGRGQLEARAFPRRVVGHRPDRGRLPDPGGPGTDRDLLRCAQLPRRRAVHRAHSTRRASAAAARSGRRQAPEHVAGGPSRARLRREQPIPAQHRRLHGHAEPVRQHRRRPAPALRRRRAGTQRRHDRPDPRHRQHRRAARGADRRPSCQGIRHRADHRRHRRVVGRGVGLHPARTAGRSVLVPRRRRHHRRLHGGRVQREPGRPATGDHARPHDGAHERDDAAHRVGHHSDRRPHRWIPRRPHRAAGDALGVGHRMRSSGSFRSSSRRCGRCARSRRRPNDARDADALLDAGRGARRADDRHASTAGALDPGRGPQRLGQRCRQGRARRGICARRQGAWTAAAAHPATRGRSRGRYGAPRHPGRYRERRDGGARHRRSVRAPAERARR